MIRKEIRFMNILNQDISLFLSNLEKSIKEGIYSNFGPNERRLKKEFEKIVGYPCVLTANATLAIEGMHNILSKRLNHCYVPGFTFLATNMTAKNYEVIPVDLEKNIGFHILPDDFKINSYLFTVAPFGAKKPSDFNIKNIKNISYWIIDAAASPLCFIKDWLDDGADAVIISLHATKILSACEGGAVFFRNQELKEEYEKYINFGLYYEGNDRFTIGIGSNHKMSELHAAWCLTHLQNSYFKDLETRFKQADLYEEMAKKNNLQYIYSPSAFWIKTKALADRVSRDIKEKYLIECKRYYYPILNNEETSRHLSLFGLCLPSYSMDEDDFKYVIDSLNDYFGETR